MNMLAKRWKAILAKGKPAPPLTPEQEAVVIRNAAYAASRMIEAMGLPESYYEEHAVCPSCGGKEMSQTCIGILSGPDRNHCVCSCGWRGIVHDLVPAGVKQDG